MSALKLIQNVLFARTGTVILMALCGLVASAGSFASTPLKVVTSFSILEDLVKQVGADQVVITNLVKADSDVHAYEPSVRDTQTLGKADLLFVNGLEFEVWMPRLKAASGFKGQEVVVSDGIKIRRFEDADHPGHDEHDHEDQDTYSGHTHGEYDPHAWQDVNNVIIYVQNIEKALSEADPENAGLYQQRAGDYMAQLKVLDLSIRDAFIQLPENKRTIAMTHEAFGYFADAYGLKLIAVMGISPNEEPTAATIAKFVKQMKQQGIAAIFFENISNTRLLEQIAKDTGVTVGGTLYTDALSASDSTAQSYLKMMQSNRDTLIEALDR